MMHPFGPHKPIFWTNGGVDVYQHMRHSYTTLADAVTESMAPVADVDAPELVMDLKFVRAKGLDANGKEYPRHVGLGVHRNREIREEQRPLADVVDCFEFEERAF